MVLKKVLGTTRELLTFSDLDEDIEPLVSQWHNVPDYPYAYNFVAS